MFSKGTSRRRRKKKSEGSHQWYGYYSFILYYSHKHLVPQHVGQMGFARASPQVSSSWLSIAVSTTTVATTTAMRRTSWASTEDSTTAPVDKPQKSLVGTRPMLVTHTRSNASTARLMLPSARTLLLSSMQLALISREHARSIARSSVSAVKCWGWMGSAPTASSSTLWAQKASSAKMGHGLTTEGTPALMHNAVSRQKRNKVSTKWSHTYTHQRERERESRGQSRDVLSLAVSLGLSDRVCVCVCVWGGGALERFRKNLSAFHSRAR